MVFYGHVPQQERDIIYVRDDIGAVAALAGIVQWGGSPSAECREQLSRFLFGALLTKGPALEAGPKFQVCGLFCVDEWVCIRVLKTIDGHK